MGGLAVLLFAAWLGISILYDQELRSNRSLRQSKDSLINQILKRDSVNNANIHNIDSLIILNNSGIKIN